MNNRKFTAAALLLIFCMLFPVNVKFEGSDLKGYRIVSDSQDHLEIEFTVSEIDLTAEETELGVFVKLDAKTGNYTKTVGSPELPIFRELIEIPKDSSPVITVLSYGEKEMRLSELGINEKIIPAQPGYSKSTPAEERKFVYEPQYYSAAGYRRHEPVVIERTGTVRGVGTGVLEIRPFDYDPVANTIKTVSNIRIRIDFTGADPDYDNIKAEEYSPFFEGTLSKLINYKPSGSKSDLVTYPVTYLIAANVILEGDEKLKEFTDWKAQKGFNVITSFFNSGTTVTEVDNWVEEQYNGLRPKPSFLLIIGDQSGTFVVPTEQNPPLGSSGGVSVSDHIYGVIGAMDSSNRIPSIHVGRFSGNSYQDIYAQIDKTIWYEKGQFEAKADLSYLANVMGVAGQDNNYATTHGNPHIRYGMEYYFNETYRLPVDNSAAGINGIAYYHPGSSATGAAAEIVAHVSSGVSFYNYTAHGSSTSFGNPYFGILHIDNLSNQGKYPLVIGNCCMTGSFGTTECFGEAWLNAPDKGGIGYIGASMNTYWDEDLVMGIGRKDSGGSDGLYLPPHTPAEQGMYDALMMMDYPTQAGVKYAGLLAVERFGGTKVNSYWSSYHLFGDPSLMVYMGVPGEKTVVHDSAISTAEREFSVEALPGSYVALSSDSGLHGAAVADQFGLAVVPVIKEFDYGFAQLTVTSQFKQPYFQQIPIESTGPRLIVSDHSFSSSFFGESGTINLELENIGIEASEGISVTASALNEFFDVSDNIVYYENIAAGDSLAKASAFSYTISPFIPDGETVTVYLTVTDNSKAVYNRHIRLTASSPVLAYDHSLNAESVEPGDDVEITFRIDNRGTAGLADVTAELILVSSLDITVSGAQNIALIGHESFSDITYSLSFNNDIPAGSNAEFTLALNSPNGYSSSYGFNIVAGITEDFENGDFSKNDWTFEGNAPWVIDGVVSYAGTYSARSGLITHNQSSVMAVTYEFLEDGDVSFYRKVSSEKDYDCLEFYVDNVLKEKWSGEKDWEQFIYRVQQGTRKLSWKYIKDGSVTDGEDFGWIDNMVATNILVGINTEDHLPGVFALNQNYPNPFNPVTTIQFSVPYRSDVKLNVYNASGQLVKSLLDRSMNAGSYKVVFDASQFMSGIYFCTLESASGKITRKMLLIK